MSKVKTSNDKNLSSIDTSISRVINNPLYPRNSSYTLLHYICENSLGTIIEFIFKMSNTTDIFYVEDDDGNTPLHILCKRMDEFEANINEFSDSYDPSYKFKNFISFPSSSTPVDLALNILIHNLCYSQMVRKTYKQKLSIDSPYKVDWNILFNLKDNKIKNRTLK
ncbi:hypothetical protein U3516DRAFT_865858 [Neocallimastix sp. 'constans']